MRVILDTNVVVAALRSPAGAAAEIVRCALRGDFVIAVSTALLCEYEAVATREEHLRAAGLSVGDVNDVLDALAAVASPVPIRWRMRPWSPDPGDDLVIEAAFNGGAQALVTSNTRDFVSACAALGIRVMTPARFLSELKRT